MHKVIVEQADIPYESGEIRSRKLRIRNTLGTGNWLYKSEESIHGKRWVGKKAMHLIKRLMS
jgi:hypothetical protein